MEYFKLNNGEKIPAINFGVYEIEIEQTKDAVLKALEVGYRAKDNAQIYYNQKEDTFSFEYGFQLRSL